MLSPKNRFLFVAIFLVSFLSLLKSQSGKGNYNYLGFQQRSYYFGIALGYNQSDYKVYRGKKFIENEQLAGINSFRGPGFNLQIISNLKLGEYFDVRFLPGFSFIERQIEFDYTKRITKDIVDRVESVLVELPFHVRYKSAPYNDKRLFVVAGIKYMYDIQSKSRTRQLSNTLSLSPTDFQAEMGVGCQFFFPFFILSPEFKVSHGLGNILIFRPDKMESTAIEKLMSRTFTFSLHFEG
jgi:hypothetical protein